MWASNNLVMDEKRGIWAELYENQQRRPQSAGGNNTDQPRARTQRTRPAAKQYDLGKIQIGGVGKLAAQRGETVIRIESTQHRGKRREREHKLIDSLGILVGKRVRRNKPRMTPRKIDNKPTHTSCTGTRQANRKNSGRGKRIQRTQNIVAEFNCGNHRTRRGGGLLLRALRARTNRPLLRGGGHDCTPAAPAEITCSKSARIERASSEPD